MHVTAVEVRVLYALFRGTADRSTGLVGVGELMGALGLEHSDFANRVFCMMEHLRGVHVSGQCDFESFVISLWNLCSLRREEVGAFCFELYDADESGYLDLKELVTLVVDISTLEYAKSDRVARIVQDLATRVRESARDALDEREFDQFCVERPLLLAPACQMRSRMRRKFGGDRFWDRIRSRRDSRSDKQHATTAFAVLRRLIMDRDASSGGDESDNADNLVELERHRVRKQKALRVEAALANRTVATAARPVGENPVVVAFNQRKFFALDVVEEIDALARTTRVATVAPDFLDDQSLTRNMRRDATDHISSRRAEVLEWLGIARRLDKVDPGEAAREIRRRHDARKDEIDVLRPETVGARAEPVTRQNTVVKRKRARRRWEVVKFRAKDAHARAMDDHDDYVMARNPGVAAAADLADYYARILNKTK